MKEILSELESEDIKKRLNALDELAKMVSAENIDRVLIIKALKSHILDWDEDVRAKVSSVLKLYNYGKNSIFFKRKGRSGQNSMHG